jgi:hypothetical protein
MIHQAASLLHLPRLCAKRSVRPAARRVYDATDRIDHNVRLADRYSVPRMLGSNQASAL